MYGLCPTWSTLVVASQKQWPAVAILFMTRMCSPLWERPTDPFCLELGKQRKTSGLSVWERIGWISILIIIVNVSLSMVVTLLYELVPEREESPFDLWKIIFDWIYWFFPDYGLPGLGIWMSMPSMPGDTSGLNNISFILLINSLINMWMKWNS